MERVSGGREKRPCASPAVAAPPSPAPEVSAEERMEVFYVLLESIKAMRDLIGVTRRSKRQKTEATAALPLWRPTFVMEDFRDVDDDGREAAGGGGEAIAAAAEEIRGEVDSSVHLSLSRSL